MTPTHAMDAAAPPRVLVVEDDPSFQQQLSDYMEYRGWAFAAVGRGDHAVEMFARDAYDLVLCDVMLPGLDGFSAVQKIRALPGGEDVPVVMISAVWNDPARFRERLLEINALEFHRKPLSILELGRRIAAILDDTDAAPGSGAATRSGRWINPAIDAAVQVDLPPVPTLGAWRPCDLIRLMVRLFRQARSGVLTLTSGGARREIGLLDGFPIWADSDRPAESLLSILVSEQVIDPGKVPGLLLASRQTGQTVAQVVLDSGACTPEVLLRADQIRTRAVLDACFDPNGGEYELHEGEHSVTGRRPTEVHPVPLLWKHAQRIDLRDLADELAGVSEHVVGPGQDFDRLYTELPLPPALDWLGSSLADQGQTVQELLSVSRTDTPLLLRALWLSLQLGIAQASPGGRAPLVGQKLQSRGRRPPALVLRVELTAPEPLEEAWRVVLADYLGLYEADFYLLLGIGPHADEAEVDAAWKHRTGRWRKAALGDNTPPQIRSRARALLARVADARDALQDPKARAAYDIELARRRAAEQEGPEGTATQRLRAARAGVKDGRWEDAATLYQGLLREHPSSVEVLHNLAWSRYQAMPTDPSTLEESIELLRHALATDPDHVRATERLDELLSVRAVASRS